MSQTAALTELGALLKLNFGTQQTFKANVFQCKVTHGSTAVLAAAGCQKRRWNHHCQLRFNNALRITYTIGAETSIHEAPQVVTQPSRQQRCHARGRKKPGKKSTSPVAPRMRLSPHRACVFATCSPMRLAPNWWHTCFYQGNEGG